MNMVTFRYMSRTLFTSKYKAFIPMSSFTENYIKKININLRTIECLGEHFIISIDLMFKLDFQCLLVDELPAFILKSIFF